MKSILLVDDDESFRQLVLPALESTGYTVLQAESGMEALQILQDNNPDLLIIDGYLPDMDGEEWIVERRAEGINTPIVFISGYWREPAAYKRLTDELGVDLLVNKPIMPLAFREQIATLLAKNSEPPVVPSGNSNTLEIALAALREKYLESLPGRTKELADAFEKARARPDDEKALLDVRGHAHKLRGTAGSYGILKYSHCAGLIDDTITSLAKDGKKPEATDWSLLEDAVREAQSLANGTDGSASTSQP
jgi:CheY-like chemotaxis protein